MTSLSKGTFVRGDISINIIQFQVYQSENGYSVVNILIDGQNIIDMVRAIELPYAEKEVHPNIAGSYEGLPENVFSPSRLLLGEDEISVFRNDDKTTLLVSECG